MSGSVKTKLPKEPLPSWMERMVKKQIALKTRYDKAHSEFVEIYNEFLLMIEEINDKYGTTFTFEQAMMEFGGEPTDEEDEEDDND